MLRKGDCRKALERKLNLFKALSSLEEELIYYHRCCAIVWFLNEMRVFDEDETFDWIERFCDASTTAWMRLFKEGKR